MSVQEIKEKIEQLSAQEQSQLESFLKTKRCAEAPLHRERIEAAHGRIDQGESVTSAQLRALLAKHHAAAS
jgi:hypothetical protein